MKWAFFFKKMISHNILTLFKIPVLNFVHLLCIYLKYKTLKSYHYFFSINITLPNFMKNNFLLTVLLTFLALGEMYAQNWPDRTVLPIEPYQKVGKVAPTIKDSDPIEWPKEISAPESAPNVLLIMIDDVWIRSKFYVWWTNTNS